MVHIYVEQTRQLIVPGGGSCNPKIVCTAFDQTLQSHTKDNVGEGTAVWNHHVYFERNDCKLGQLENAVASIQVLNAGFFSDEVLGVFEADLSTIQKGKDHVILHQWVALMNPSSDNPCAPSGFLKQSINMTGPDDDGIPLEQDLGEGEESGILLPPSIDVSSAQLEVRVLKGELNCPEMDLIGKVDPFVKISFGGGSVSTSQIDGDDMPVWNDICYLPFMLPTSASKICIQLFDSDYPFGDDLIASNQISYKDLKENGYKQKDPQWINFYGPSRQATEETVWTKKTETES